MPRSFQSIELGPKVFHPGHSSRTFFLHLAKAALRARSRRSSGVILAAEVLPPFDPPFLPPILPRATA